MKKLILFLFLILTQFRFHPVEVAIYNWSDTPDSQAGNDEGFVGETSRDALML